MTRKDYVLLAAALRTALEATREDMQDSDDRFACVFGVIGAATAIADALARDNQRFDRDRFLKAAGVKSLQE